MRYLGASVSGLLAAPVEKVWEVVSDPTRHPEIAGSGQVQKVEIVGGGPMGPGVVFQSSQRVSGFNYVTASRTVIWEPLRCFAWRVGFPFAPGVAQIWMFSLSPEAGGTRVENGLAQIYALPTFFPFSIAHDELGRREANLMTPTLTNLAYILGTTPPTELVERYEIPAALEALLPWPMMQGAIWESSVSMVTGVLGQVTRRTG